MLLQCKPLSFFWTRMAHHPVVNIQGEGSCINMEIIVAMTYVYSAFAGMCDFTVGILPVFVVRKLHMKRQTKLAVVGILSMACMCVTTLIQIMGFWDWTATKLWQCILGRDCSYTVCENVWWFGRLFVYALFLHLSLRSLALTDANSLKMLPFRLPTGQTWKSASVLLLAVSQPSVRFCATGSVHTQIHHIPLVSRKNRLGAQLARVGSDRYL